MSKLSQFKRKKTQDDGVYASISDLMSGLMIVFLFIAVSFMSRVTDESIQIKKQQETIEKVVNAYDDTKGEIYNDLYKEFQDDLDKWHMEIDEDGTIRFTEPEVFFADDEATLKKEFKEILDSFFPRYIDVIYNNHKDNVKEIKIEGHTSSKWEKDSTKMESYFGNMKLSQERTINVLMYVMKLDKIKPYENWLISNITANGMSYSKRIYNEDKKEDKDASRRVEFRVITNAEEIIDEIGQEYSK